MLDIEEIENTIHELEEGDTTFDTCIKLSALYNVREHILNAGQKVTDNVTKELGDILPHYEAYIRAKQNYQLEKVGEETVVQYMTAVCQEIKEFMLALYTSTDTPQERFLLHNMVKTLLAKIPE